MYLLSNQFPIERNELWKYEREMHRALTCIASLAPTPEWDHHGDITVTQDFGTTTSKHACGIIDSLRGSHQQKMPKIIRNDIAAAQQSEDREEHGTQQWVC